MRRRLLLPSAPRITAADCLDAGTRVVDGRALLQNPQIGARGHLEFRAFTEREWSTAMDTLSESNPLFVFREGCRLGLGGVAGHGYADSVAALRGLVSRKHPLLQPPAAYTQADVDGMVSFILERGCI